jgi:DNA-binding transcriptional ArsR family regulator
MKMNSNLQGIPGHFEKIFHSAPARIIDFLMTFSEFDYSESDIARRTGLSKKTVSIELRRLSEEEVVELTRWCGPAQMYRINDKGPALELRRYVKQKRRSNVENAQLAAARDNITP